MNVKPTLGERIIERAHRGYHDRKDYPPYAIAAWDDRRRWSEYIVKIANEIEAEDAAR